MKRLCFLLLSLCFLQSCNENNIESNTHENLVSFYLLKDTKITATESVKNGIESLQLSEEPIFSSKEMSYYNWKDHSFSIDSISVKKLQDYSNLHKSVFGIPFIVTVDEKRIYLGAFWFNYSSIAPTFPHIAITFYSQNPSLVLTINKSWSDLEPDMRNDKRIYIALKNNGLLIE
jgi:hypothetical protein